MRFAIPVTIFAAVATLTLAVPIHHGESSTAIVPARVHSEPSLVLKDGSEGKAASVPSHHDPDLIRRMMTVQGQRKMGNDYAALARAHRRVADDHRTALVHHVGQENYLAAANSAEEAQAHDHAATKADHIRDFHRSTANMIAAHERANNAQNDRDIQRHMNTATRHYDAANRHFNAAIQMK